LVIKLPSRRGKKKAERARLTQENFIGGGSEGADRKIKSGKVSRRKKNQQRRREETMIKTVC